MGVYQKILNVMTAVERIQKDDTVDYKTTHYKALSEEKVTTIMRAEMVKQGLIVFPVKQDWTKDGYISHVDVTYKIVDVETGESVEVVSCGDGADTQDKGAGKAMTYAFKYMWLRTFAIPTGEDPDKIASAQLDDEQETKKKIEKSNGYKEDADYRGASRNVAKRLQLDFDEVKALLSDEQRAVYTFGDDMTNVQWFGVYCALKKYETEKKGAKA